MERTIITTLDKSQPNGDSFSYPEKRGLPVERQLSNLEVNVQHLDRQLSNVEKNGPPMDNQITYLDTREELPGKTNGTLNKTDEVKELEMETSKF